MIYFLKGFHFTFGSFTVISFLWAILVNNTVNTTEYQQIDKNISYKIHQAQKLKTFAFESIQQDKFYTFTLEILNNYDNNCKILLSSDKDSEIQYYKDNNRYESSAQFNDQNSYLNNKQSHQIKFNPKDNSNKVVSFLFLLFIQVQYFFVFFENFSICNAFIYQITITESDQYECLNQCGGHGICSFTESQQCNCDAQHVDQDCNIQILEFNTNSKVYATISAQSCEYLKFKCNTYPNLQELLLLKQTKAQFEIFYKIFYESDYNNNILKSYLPNEYINDGKSLIQPEINIQPLPIQHECLTNERKEGEVIVSICNKAKTSSNIQIQLLIQESTQKSQSSPISISKIVMFSLIGIFVLFLMITITYFYIKYRYQHSHMQIHFYPDNSTNDTINKYMKVQKYSEVIEIQSKIEQVNQFCSICLGEFQMDELVRQAICQHIFHSTCLEKWIYQHQNCPYCRAGLTKKDFEQYTQTCFLKTQTHQLSTQNELPYENKLYLNFEEILPKKKHLLKMKTTETLLHINYNEEDYSNIPNTIRESQNAQSPQIKSLFTLRESVQIEQNSEESSLNQIDSLEINTSFNLQEH